MGLCCTEALPPYSEFLTQRGRGANAPLADDNAVDPLGHGSTVWLQDLNPNTSLRHAMHLDVSVARERAQARVRSRRVVA